MSNQVGVLDGLRDIVLPVMPTLADWTLFYIIASAIVLTGIAFLILYKYKKRSRIQAKKSYKELKSQWMDLQAQDCGERIMLILRLLLGQHNLSENDYVTYELPFSQQQWSWMLKQSNQLRFSTTESKPENAIKVLPLIEKMLWPNQ